MKAKCPFCKQSYDFTDDNIFEYDGKNLQCANCNEEFTLREVLPCLEKYKVMIDKKKELAETKEALVQEKKDFKKYKKNDDDYDYMDEERFEKAGAEIDIDMLETEIDNLKQELETAKDEYQGAKEDLPQKTEVNDLYAVEMYSLFENGLLKSPLVGKEKERIKRLISMGNCGYLLEKIIIDSSLRYCLIDEMQAICDRLANDRYLPLPPHEYRGDGTITPQQLELLVRFGLNADDLKQISKAEASWTISVILNKHNEARDEWLSQIHICKDKEAVLAKIQEFYTSPVIIPPPKKDDSSQSIG